SSPTISAPTLLSAVFSNTGQYIFVTMSGQTDRARTVLTSVTNTFKCSLVLTFPGASEDQCVWTDTKTIRVTVTSTSVFAKVGDTLSLQAGRTRAFCATGPGLCGFALYSPAASVLIGRPSEPISPVVKILSPSPINRCSNIVLDTTTSTGRGSAPWKLLTWAVSSSTSNPTSSVKQRLDSVTTTVTSVFTVGNDKLSAGTYTFQLCATNMFGEMSCATADVVVSANANLPTVSLTGVTSMLRYQPVTFYGSAAVAGCNGAASTTTGLSYAFQLYQGTSLQSIPSVSNNPNFFKLNAFTLQPNTAYHLVVTVTSPSGVSNSASHRFSVGRSKTKALIAQGSLTTVYEKGVRTISAGPSYDLDYPTDRTNLAYTWDCIEYTPSFGSPCPVTFPSTTSISFRGDDFNATNEYQLTVAVRNVLVVGSDDTASIVVYVKPGLPIPTLDFKNVQEKYNRDVRLLLPVDVNTLHVSSEARWSLFDSDGNALDLQAIALTPLTKTLSAGVTPLSLTVASFTLSEGESYTFRIVATYFPLESPDVAETVAEVVVVINEAPWGGVFEVEPPNGTAAVTLFSLSANDWVDDPSDYPLSFKFAF
ncbi:unnamed protein product, partial [Ectocarpus fasciculatus]